MGRTYAERIITYLDPDLPGILHATVEDTDQEYKMFHEWYYLGKLTVCPNEIHATYRGARERVDVGTLYLLEPRESMVVEAGGGGGSSGSMFVAPAILNLAADSPEEGRIHFSNWKCRDEEVIDLFDGVCLAIREKAPLMERQSTLAEFLSLLLERCASRTLPAGPPRVPVVGIEKARQAILARYAEPLSLDALADIAGLNRYSLTRAFSQQFGISTHEYLVKVRVAKAQDLIGHGAPFLEAAIAAGFSDQSHFIRHFRQVFKMSPGEFWGDRRSK